MGSLTRGIAPVQCILQIQILALFGLQERDSTLFTGWDQGFSKVNLGGRGGGDEGASGRSTC